MANQQDELKSHRHAFDFLRELFPQDKLFTKADLAQYASWSDKSISTYWSKQFETFVQPVPPILRGAQQKHQLYRVTDVFLTVGTWPKFRRHVSQKRRLTFKYKPSTYQAKGGKGYGGAGDPSGRERGDGD